MLQNHLSAARFVELTNGGVGQQRAALRGIKRAGGNDGTGRHQLPARLGSQERLQVGRSDGVDHAQNPPLVAEEAASGIAK